MGCCIYGEKADACENFARAARGFIGDELRDLASETGTVENLLKNALGEHLRSAMTPDNMESCVSELPELHSDAGGFIDDIDHDITTGKSNAESYEGDFRKQCHDYHADNN